jgi:hypothetical protein
MPDQLVVPIPEIRVPGRRKGRHLNHDVQSRRFPVPRRAVKPTTVKHERRIPILDQDDIGSCTCSSSVGVLGTDPFFELLPDELQVLLSDAEGAQRFAEDLYRETSRNDPFPGGWEPDDTGSDGLSIAKTLKRRGIVPGYLHAFGIDDAHRAIQERPFITGTIWLSGMSNPTREGIVTATGTGEGGHEYQCDGYNAERDLWEFPNTWTEDFGDEGWFYMDTPNFARLLAMQGDVTSFVLPEDASPEPVEPEVPDPFGEFPWDVMDRWEDNPRKYADARRAYTTWKAGLGLD